MILNVFLMKAMRKFFKCWEYVNLVYMIKVILFEIFYDIKLNDSKRKLVIR